MGFQPPPPPKKKRKKTQKKTNFKNWSKLALKTGPSMLRNKIGPVFNARNGSFVFVYFYLFLENPLFFCRENEIFKNKKKSLDQFLTLEKAKFGPTFNSTAHIYIYIHTHIERESNGYMEREM